MNDFFTELDSDLFGTKKTEVPPTNIPPVKNTIPVNNLPPIKNIIPKGPIPLTPLIRREEAGKNHVLNMRTQMMQAWVITLVYKADEKTRTLLGNLKIETRGFAYLEEVRTVHKMVIKKARASYEDTLRDIPDIEEKDLLKIIRRDLEIFLLQKMNRNPVIIPIIISA